ncbi:hypothetical protein M426DRAFT_26132 [Hypoxylon sp. CI-4A]|nr:hypothetical protein M426DRAFT_26132 [Hypoxylon sp. CI-4A]
MADEGSEGRCVICDEPNAFLCERCKGCRYCSRQCQRADWPTHKMLCAGYLKFDATTRPTENHFKAIQFPLDRSNPQLVWVYGSFDDISKTFFMKGAPVQNTPVERNPASHRKLSNTIHVCSRATDRVHGSSLNQCVEDIIATQPYPCHDWQGSFLVYGMNGSGPKASFKDIDMYDFRQAIDYFISHGRRRPVPTITPETIKGVRINCPGDRMMFKKPEYEAVDVLSTDYIFVDHDVSDMANRMELPIITRRCRPDPIWEDVETFKASDGKYLHTCCDQSPRIDPITGVTKGALALMKFLENDGSLIVVRQDKKPLHPLHVEALCRYGFDVANGLTAPHNPAYSPLDNLLRRGTTSATISRHGFTIFWRKMLDEKKQDGKDTNVPDPYHDAESTN